MGLRKKTFIYVGVGFITTVIIVSLVSFQSLNQSIEIVSEQKLAIAKNIAISIDGLLQHMLRVVEDQSSTLGDSWQSNPTDSDAKEHLILLRSNLQRHLVLLEPTEVDIFVALLDAQGKVLQTEPFLEQQEGHSLADNPIIRNVLQEGQAYTEVEEAILTGDSPTLTMVVPIKNNEELIKGLVVADIPAAPGAFTSFFQPWTTVYDLEVVTESGLVVAGSETQMSINESEHWDLIHLLAEERLAGFKEHPESEEREAHIVAFAPLEQVPWFVVLEESRKDILALPNAVGQRLLIASGMAVVIAAVLIWVFTRQVLNRIRRLAVVAEKFGTGDLEAEVPTMQQDEIGQLARSFETMRRRLKHSLNEISQWNRVLEQRVKERTKELEGLYQQLHRKDDERGYLLRKIITAQEEERRRIARELHDDISQTLTGLGMSLGSVEALMTSDPAAAKRGLESLQHATSEAVENARRLIRNLRPSLLDDLGLVPAISWYVENYLDVAGVKAKLKTSGSDQDLSPMIQIVIFRIVQEAITNIVKHAQAKTAHIYLQFTPSAIVGSIEDDGRGFNVDALHTEKREGTGLLGIEERIELLKGKLTIESKPGKGTRIHFEILK
jgi:signal transduction histidine kinase